MVSVRPLQNGRHLIGCRDAAQQGTLSRCQRLTGGVAIKCLIPVPTVEGVIGPIPLEEWALRKVKADLLAGGHRVTGVTRLNNRTGEPSRAVRITLERCSVPAEVWIASTPFQVAPFAASARRCTRCQAVGHTTSRCRARAARCSRCGTAGHLAGGCTNTYCCVNCNGRHSASFRQCPEMLVHSRANIIRSGTYLPFSVALQRARGELFGGANLPAQPTSQGSNQEQTVKPD